MEKTKPAKTSERSRETLSHLLEVKGVCTFYGEAQALNKINLFVNTNEIVAVLGSNGAGKTTLLKTLDGLLTPRYGQIIFGDESIEGMPPNDIIGKGIASVPEGRELFGSMSVADNLLLGAYSLSKRERKEIFSNQLAMIFSIFPVLEEKLKQKAETLSGGEQQMLAVGRALIPKPKLLALDEPSLGLSPILTMEMMNSLKHLCSQKGIAILLVEQNAKAALKIADYVYVLERGDIVLQGGSKEVMANPRIYDAYLGG